MNIFGKLFEVKDLPAEDVDKNQEIVLYGESEKQLDFLDQLDIGRDHLSEEIDRLTTAVKGNLENQDYYKHLLYRVFISDELIKRGQVKYHSLFDSIKDQVGDVDQVIFDEVWAEIKKRAQDLK